ncbi:hypothetical protein PI124_g13322 [Phytophthora idaei]|nr:hypothetical protein PI125_g12809 [Phytophthora idaei]KAG3149749.1 hypothetical protein PI126_g11876 [Phytophthora idaei]KAG3241815.1 hypothetical protein PI124_g13322 [Phytophthora idaei]
MIISLWTGHEIQDKDRTVYLVNCAPTDGNNRASFTAPIWRKVHSVRLRLETTLADNEIDLHNSAVGPTKPGSAPRSGNLGRSEHDGAPSNIAPPTSGAGKKGYISKLQGTKTTTLPRDARGVLKRVTPKRGGLRGSQALRAWDSGVDYVVTDVSDIM